MLRPHDQYSLFVRSLTEHISPEAPLTYEAAVHAGTDSAYGSASKQDTALDASPNAHQSFGFVEDDFWHMNEGYVREHPDCDPRKADFSQAAEIETRGSFTKSCWKVGGLFVKAFMLPDEMEHPFDTERTAKDEYLVMLDLEGSTHAPRPVALGHLFDGERVRPAIAETYVEGEPLVGPDGRTGSYYSLLGGGKVGVDPLQLLEGCASIAEAVADVAACHVVHRAIAPSTLFLSKSEWDSVVNVTIVDFEQACSTRGNMVVTTPAQSRPSQPAYAAPEMFGGEFTAMRDDTSVDVWPLGAVCSFILTGDTPPLDTASALDGKRAFGETGLPRETVGALGDVGPKVAEIVKGCLSYDPSKRPDAQRVALELRKCAGEMASWRLWRVGVSFYSMLSREAQDGDTDKGTPDA